MSETDVALVREVYEAFNRGDIDRVAEIFHPEIEWIEPEGYPVPESRGRIVGRDEVLATFGLYERHWASFAPSPEEFIDAGDGMVFVIGRQVGTGATTGRDVSSSFINQWRVRDGQAILHRSWSDTKLLSEAAG